MVMNNEVLTGPLFIPNFKKERKNMKKKMMAVLLMALLLCMAFTGCAEVNQVSNNISQEADNFNVTRKLTVVNARTDTILLELTGLQHTKLVIVQEPMLMYVAVVL